MKKVKAKHHVTHQGKNHKPGDVFEVPDHEVKQLVDQGHVEEHPAEDPPPTEGAASK